MGDALRGLEVDGTRPITRQATVASLSGVLLGRALNPVTNPGKAFTAAGHRGAGG
jgi:hypothetical protein